MEHLLATADSLFHTSGMGATTMADTTIFEVADYFILKTREVGDLITHLKLQKLAYYAQAWYLALYSKPSVDARFEAWVHGPASPELYKRFEKYHGGQPISETVDEPAFAATITDHLEEVFDVYGGFSGLELERLTHAEEPWLSARKGLALDEPSNAEISPDIMREFYRARLANGKE